MTRSIRTRFWSNAIFREHILGRCSFPRRPTREHTRCEGDGFALGNTATIIPSEASSGVWSGVVLERTNNYSTPSSSQEDRLLYRLDRYFSRSQRLSNLVRPGCLVANFHKSKGFQNPALGVLYKSLKAQPLFRENRCKGQLPICYVNSTQGAEIPQYLRLRLPL